MSFYANIKGAVSNVYLWKILQICLKSVFRIFWCTIGQYCHPIKINLYKQTKCIAQAEHYGRILRQPTLNTLPLLIMPCLCLRI